MEDSTISVEELDICFGDNKVVQAAGPPSPEIEYVKEEEDELETSRTRKGKKTLIDHQEIHRARSPTWTRLNEQRSPCRYSPLPSLGTAKDRSLIEGFERSRAQQDTVWNLCTALNVPSKEQTASLSSSDTQIDICTEQSEHKPGKTLLAPLRDRKQLPRLQQSCNECSVVRPEVSLAKGKHMRKNKEELQSIYFTPISKTSAENSHEELHRPKERFLSPAPRGSLEDVASLDFSQNRRFSAPISPRFARRINPERLYSSRKADGCENDQYSGREACPDRGSIFSPPLKDFDAIQDHKDEDVTISKHFIHSDIRRGPRRSLDLNFDANSTRFLSHIKVSLPESTSTEALFPKARTKPEKRKNSYILSASSETLFKDSLPEVVPRSLHNQSSVRSRSSTFTSLEAVVPLESRAFGRSSFESPMFLEPGTRKLSHLSLSPRFSRKR
jgi:hypothetical protein